MIQDRTREGSTATMWLLLVSALAHGCGGESKSGPAHVDAPDILVSDVSDVLDTSFVDVALADVDQGDADDVDADDAPAELVDRSDPETPVSSDIDSHELIELDDDAFFDAMGGGVDVTVTDSGSDESSDVYDEPDVGPCCEVEPICAQGTSCRALAPSGETQRCLPTALEPGACFLNSDCGSDESVVCLHPKIRACGLPSEPGVCGSLWPPCCEVDSQCGEGQSCVGGFCWDDSPLTCAGGTQTWELCLPGYECTAVGQGFSGLCSDGAWPPSVGACIASSMGGVCSMVPQGSFGECDNELGWHWVGNTCEQAIGCSCEPYCDAMFSTEAECLARCLPAACCLSDLDCPSGSHCLPTHGDHHQTRGGFCVAIPPVGVCWGDADCGPFERCQGTEVGACSAGGQVLDSTPVPGKCVAAFRRCHAPDGCPGGLVCVGRTGDSAGTCLLSPLPGQCWTAMDCASGEWCGGATLCDIDPGCKPAPGVCAPTPVGCCSTSSDCLADQACALTSLASPWATLGQGTGLCVVDAGGTGCVDNDDCIEKGTRCVGVQSDCESGAFAVGTCAVDPSYCCASDEDCPSGHLCVGDIAAGAGTCRPPPPAGRCRRDSDCTAGAECVGAEWCMGCTDCPAQFGTCAPSGATCCVDDADCASSLRCSTIPGSKEPGVCVSLWTLLGPPEPTCFRDEHCTGGRICVMETPLACPNMTQVDSWVCGYMQSPEECITGRCRPPLGVACKTADDCPPAWACLNVNAARYDDGSVPLGTSSGACAPPLNEGECWTTVDCASGSQCIGAFLSDRPLPGSCLVPPT